MHLKRLSAPRVLRIPRKVARFVTRALPGRHPLEASIPLAIILRDYLKLVDTYAEAKKVVHLGKILVDGEVVREPRLGIGLMDIVSIPSIGRNFRILPRFKRGLEIIEINEEESSIKLCQVKRKQHVKGGNIQFTLHDGRNLQFQPGGPEVHNIKVGDTYVIEVPGQRVRAVIRRVVGSYCLITGGSRMGLHGRLVEIDEYRLYPAKRHASLDSGIGRISTVLDYFMPVGEDKPWIRLP